MSTSRETARDELVTLLTTALVGTGLPVKTVVGSKVTTLQGLTPLVSVLSAGTKRTILTFHGDRAEFKFEVQVWVLQATTGWTNAQAEDALDDIEARIAAVYESNRGIPKWEILQYDGETTVHELPVEGIPYYMESIPTRVKLATN